MKLTAKRVLPVAISALAIALLGASNAPGVPQLPMPANGAMIYNPGTGDYSGYRIVVVPDGRAIAIDGAGHSAIQLQSDVVTKFFDDLASAGPLGQLSARPCSADVNAPTTVELNSSITITWKGQRSPALTCATDGPAQALLLDATQIQHSLYVQAYRKRNLMTYGTASNTYSTRFEYASGSYASFSPDQFYLPRWQNQDIQFQMEPMYFEHFDAGIETPDPFADSPYTGAPTTTLQYTTPAAAAPYASIPVADPWASPNFSTPFGAPPWSSLGTSSPYSGSGVYTTNTP